MARILITGAAGYIGSVLTNRLLREGHTVTAIDNLSHGVPSLLSCVDYERFIFVRGDARDRRVILPAVKANDVIIPLAAIVGAPACALDKAGAWSTNYDSVGLICSNVGSGQRIIYPNTNSGYGTTPPGTWSTEETPLKPISIYAETKAAAEERVVAQSGTVFRLATVFGVSPRMRFDLMFNDFVLRAWRDKAITLFEATAVRNFVHVLDVAEAFIAAIDGHIPYGVYNCGNSKMNMTKLELCASIKRLVHDFAWFLHGAATDPDKRDYAVSNVKLEHTGWKAKRDTYFGIEQVLVACSMTPRGMFANV